MASPPLLEVRGLAKAFFGVPVLYGIDLTLEGGQALGLVGENGSGKSTSMNIVGGVHRADAGSLHIDGQPFAPDSPKDAIAAGIAFIHQELNLFLNLTIEENLFIDAFPCRAGLPLIDRRAIRRRTEEMLSLVELDLRASTVVGRLSQGERQLVEIAKALSRNARIMIFDEPTTSLTRPEVLRLFDIIERLKARGLGVIYISHTLEDVVRVCETVTVLRDGALAGSGRRADMPLSRIVSMMVGRSVDTVFPERAAPASGSGMAPVLEVRGLSQPGVARAISFEIAPGEILGLAGLMGSGRSELARMLFGLDPFAEGTIRVQGRDIGRPTPARAMAAGMAFLTEDRRGEGLLLDFSVTENMVLASLASLAGHLGALSPARLTETALGLARDLALTTTAVDATKVKHLSGGNQQKVVIGKWLRRQPVCFILDEPTRGIDVGAKQEVYRIINALVAAGSAVLLISSEIEELIGLSDRILTIDKGELTGEFARSAFDREAIMRLATGIRTEAVA